MKHISAAILLLLAPTASAFSTYSNGQKSRDVQLFAVDRRTFLSSAAAASTVAITMPIGNAFAAGDAVRFEEMKQIVNFGYSLDSLVSMHISICSSVNFINRVVWYSAKLPHDTLFDMIHHVIQICVSFRLFRLLSSS